MKLMLLLAIISGGNLNCAKACANKLVLERGIHFGAELVRAIRSEPDKIGYKTYGRTISWYPYCHEYYIVWFGLEKSDRAKVFSHGFELRDPDLARKDIKKLVRYIKKAYEQRLHRKCKVKYKKTHNKVDGTCDSWLIRPKNLKDEEASFYIVWWRKDHVLHIEKTIDPGVLLGFK